MLLGIASARVARRRTTPRPPADRAQPGKHPQVIDLCPLDDVTALLRPVPADGLRIWPVALMVNNVKNDGPELLEPYSVPVAKPVLV